MEAELAGPGGLGEQVLGPGLDPLADLLEPGEQPGPVGVRRTGGCQAVEGGERLAHLLDAEAERLHALDHLEPVDRCAGVEAEAALVRVSGTTRPSSS